MVNPLPSPLFNVPKAEGRAVVGTTPVSWAAFKLPKAPPFPAANAWTAAGSAPVGTLVNPTPLPPLKAARPAGKAATGNTPLNCAALRLVKFTPLFVANACSATGKPAAFKLVNPLPSPLFNVPKAEGRAVVGTTPASWAAFKLLKAPPFPAANACTAAGSAPVGTLVSPTPLPLFKDTKVAGKAATGSTPFSWAALRLVKFTPLLVANTCRAADSGAVGRLVNPVAFPAFNAASAAGSAATGTTPVNCAAFKFDKIPPLEFAPSVIKALGKLA